MRSVKRRARRIARRVGRLAFGAPHGRYSRGVSQNCLARAAAAVLSSPGPRRRRRTRESPKAPTGILGNASTGAHTALRRARIPAPGSSFRGLGYPSTVNHHRRIPSTNGREAGLASRPRRAPGLPLPGQLRDVAARHRSSSTSTTAVPDRRPERLRQGLARDPLPLADQPDARPGSSATASRSSSSSGPRRRRGAVTAASPADAAGAPGRPGPPAGPGRADPGRRRGRDDQPQPALHLLELHRRVGQPPRPRRQPVGRGAARATPTTRSSCTAAWASARPT